MIVNIVIAQLTCQSDACATQSVCFTNTTSLTQQHCQLERFSTPKGTSWQDITIQFIDGHTVRVTCNVHGEVISRIYNFTQMGMVDRRTGSPNRQWALLMGFAEEGGRFTWHNPRANARQKQQKQALKSVLQAFFNIQDTDPFTYVKDRHNYGYYQALFKVLPE